MDLPVHFQIICVDRRRLLGTALDEYLTTYTTTVYGFRSTEACYTSSGVLIVAMAFNGCLCVLETELQQQSEAVRVLPAALAAAQQAASPIVGSVY